MNYTIPKKEYMKAAGFVTGILEELYSKDEVATLNLPIVFAEMYIMNITDTNNATQDTPCPVDINLYSTEFTEYCTKGSTYAGFGSVGICRAIGALSQFFGSVVDATTEEGVHDFALGIFNEIVGLLCPVLCEKDMGCWGQFNIA